MGGQEVIFTENTAPDREIWDEKGGLIKKGAAEIAERDQDHVPEVKVLTTWGMFAVPVTAETTIGEFRQKVQEWKPEYSLEQIELVCKDKDAWGPLFNKTSRPRDEIAERDQDHVPEVKVLTTLGMFAVPCTAETTIGEIRQKVQEWKPEYSLEQIELVCKDKDAWGPL